MSEPTQSTQMIVERVIPATPEQIFALLADPDRHQETEPTDWVRGALPPKRTITEVGQVFGIEMHHVNAGGRYEMHNRVIALEPGRTIAWEPSQYSEQGELQGGGWTWRYDLAPEESGTRVTLTYDWSATPEPLRDQLSLPPFGSDFLDESLASLDRAVTSS